MSIPFRRGHAAPPCAPKGTCACSAPLYEGGGVPASFHCPPLSPFGSCEPPPHRGRGGRMSSLCFCCRRVPPSQGPLAAAASSQSARACAGRMCAWVSWLHPGTAVPHSCVCMRVCVCVCVCLYGCVGVCWETALQVTSSTAHTVLCPIGPVGSGGDMVPRDRGATASKTQSTSPRLHCTSKGRRGLRGIGSTVKHFGSPEKTAGVKDPACCCKLHPPSFCAAGLAPSNHLRGSDGLCMRACTSQRNGHEGSLTRRARGPLGGPA